MGRKLNAKSVENTARAISAFYTTVEVNGAAPSSETARRCLAEHGCNQAISKIIADRYPIFNMNPTLEAQTVMMIYNSRHNGNRIAKKERDAREAEHQVLQDIELMTNAEIVAYLRNVRKVEVTAYEKREL